MQEDHTIELDPYDIELLINLALQITSDPTDTPELFCKQAKECSQNVPQRIKDALINFALKGNDKGFLLIKGIDVLEIHKGLIEKTPDGNNSRVGEKTLLARVQSILVSTL